MLLAARMLPRFGLQCLTKNLPCKKAAGALLAGTSTGARIRPPSRVASLAEVLSVLYHSGSIKSRMIATRSRHPPMNCLRVRRVRPYESKLSGVKLSSVNARRKSAKSARVSENLMRQGLAPVVRNPFSRCDLQMSSSQWPYFW